jgi:hypothetical protein
MCQLYPSKLSGCFQLEQMLKSIGVDMHGDIASFPRHLAEFDKTMVDPERVCFLCVQHSDEKTLSFFRLMSNIDSAASFRSFLSSRNSREQNFLLLFLTSGL